jgi:hypothetical protein
MVFLCTQSLLQPPMSLTFAFLWMYDHRIVWKAFVPRFHWSIHVAWLFLIIVKKELMHL